MLTPAKRIGVGCPSTLDCQSRVIRTVWDGERIIYEIKAPGGELSDSVPVPSIESDAEFVSYSYAPGVLGIDEPIEIHKGTETVIPHTGWGGMLAMGTYTDGTPSDCAVANPCTRIDWPAMNVTTDGAGYNRTEPSTWYGSIASSGSEGSGLQYMRNRYYDPKRGQFTQADPIGLAGGMNLYGFASGDAINFSDPFGLCPPDDKDESDCGSAYYARRVASGKGNRLVNEVAGAINACNESIVCGVGMWGLIGARLAKVGVSIGMSILKAGRAGEVLSGAERAMQKQFEVSGRASLERTIKRLTGRIAAHEADIIKYRKLGGPTTSMEREIRAWKETIKAAKNILEKK